MSGAMGLTASLVQERGRIQRSFTGRFEYRDFVSQDTRDGPFAQMRLAWSLPLGERGQLHWGLGAERHAPQVAYQRCWGLRTHVGYSHAVTDTVQLGANLGGAFNRYDSPFAQVDFNRSDDVLSLHLSVRDTRIKIAGAVPKLSCGFTDHRSNIALYDTTYTDCNVSFSFDF